MLCFSIGILFVKMHSSVDQCWMESIHDTGGKESQWQRPQETPVTLWDSDNVLDVNRPTVVQRSEVYYNLIT